jgi:hypothetical protein
MRTTPSKAIFAVLFAAFSPALATKEAAKEVLPFIADDYPKALALARAGKKPIFMETWAPW